MGQQSVIEFGQHPNDFKPEYIDGNLKAHNYTLQTDTALNRPLMVLNLTAAYVFGEEIVKDTKAVIATNQQRVFIFGGNM